MCKYAACGGGAAAVHGDHCGVGWSGVSAADAVLSTRGRQGGSSCDGSRSGQIMAPPTRRFLEFSEAYVY